MLAVSQSVPKYGIIRLLLLKRNLPVHNGRRSVDGTGTNWNFPGSQVISFLAKMSDIAQEKLEDTE
jgi:hypothetical protein